MFGIPSRPTPENGAEWMSFALGVFIGVVAVLGAIYILVRLMLLSGWNFVWPLAG